MHRLRSFVPVLFVGFGILIPAQAQVYQLARLNTEQIRPLNPAKTIVVIPGGILEEHGPYLPSYSDGFLAEAYSRELANAIVSRPGWTVLMFPEIPVGVGGANSIGGKDIFPGSYNVRLSTLRGVYMDLASMLGEQGFRWIFVVFMHDGPENHLALEQASDYFHDVYGGNMVHLWDLKPIHDCCDTAQRMLTECHGQGLSRPRTPGASKQLAGVLGSPTLCKRCIRSRFLPPHLGQDERSRSADSGWA
jgi:creatinine amidohydrolase/Fe(II)-dependent formamide hydrolase-like protein